MGIISTNYSQFIIKFSIREKVEEFPINYYNQPSTNATPRKIKRIPETNRIYFLKTVRIFSIFSALAQENTTAPITKSKGVTKNILYQTIYQSG
jgi:hypothetical protein